MKRLVLTIAILIGLAAPAWAGLVEGVAAYNRGDYATALREFRPLANHGDSLAQSYLGVVLRNALAVVVHEAEVVLGFGMALVDKWAPLPQGCGVIATLIGGSAFLKARPGRRGQANQNGDGEYEPLHWTRLR